MKIIKIILYYLLLVSTLYAGVSIISPYTEQGGIFRLHLCIGLSFQCYLSEAICGYIIKYHA